MISLIGSVINPVKSCTSSGHSFLQQEFVVWGLMAFMDFSINNGISTSINLTDFHDVLSIRVLFHVVENPFHRVLCVMSLKDPYEPLI